MPETNADQPASINNQPLQRVDRLRNSAGSMTVGLPAEGNIKEILTIGDDRLLMIKERAIYEIKMADMIDPARSNEKIPNIQQRLFSAGTDSQLVQKILLTSEALFNGSYLKDINCKSVLSNAVNALGELLAMDRILRRIVTEENRLIAELKGQSLSNGFIIPTLDDLHPEVKNFLQRADHFVREINYITRHFEHGFGNWDRLAARARAERPVNDEYVDFLSKSIPYIHFIRECRNSVEHPSAAKRVDVYNFELNSKGEITPPSIEFRHPKYGEPRTRLLAFLEATIGSLANLYSAWIAHLSARNARFAGFDLGVMVLSNEQRRYPDVAYSYAIFFKGSWQPLG